jgi:hypothetical protein
LLPHSKKEDGEKKGEDGEKKAEIVDPNERPILKEEELPAHLQEDKQVIISG